jgi:hypothetical protein
MTHLPSADPVLVPPDIMGDFSTDPGAALRRVAAWDDARVGVKTAPLDGKEALRVAWLIARHPYDGGEWYRATRPAALTCDRYGWHTAICQRVGDDATGKTKKVLGLTLGGHEIEPDVWVLRPLGRTEEGSPWSLAKMVDQCHAAGQYVIADLDDNVWSHEDWQADAGDTGDWDFEAWCWSADAWLVSTPYLAEVVKERGDRRKGWPHRKVPVLVAPNCFDPFGMNGRALPGRRIGDRLWLWGRMGADLELYRELFVPLLEDLDLTWVHVGKEPPSTARHTERSFAELGVPADRLVEVPSVHLPEMGRTLASLLNIGAMAVAPMKFNEAKTLTHPVELGCAGLPIVLASELDIYKDVPGVVEPDPVAVRKRMLALLDREKWAEQADEAKTWARAIAAQSQDAYLTAVHEVVDLLTSR